PADSMWIVDGEEAPTRTRNLIGAAKTMFTVFWGAEQMFHVHSLPKGKSMTSTTFVQDVLNHLVVKMEDENYSVDEPIYIHYDNATSHNSSNTKEFLKQFKLTRIAHPPYTTDLSPSDFYLFGYLKGKLKGSQFKTVEECVERACKILLEISKQKLKDAFDNWLERAWWVNQNGGAYYPH
ncbi:MAG: putative mariner transposase, partial [Streblomastix strix]